MFGNGWFEVHIHHVINVSVLFQQNMCGEKSMQTGNITHCARDEKKTSTFAKSTI